MPFAAGAEITRRWAGIMGFTPDMLPLMGPAPGLDPSIHVLAGFSGHGVGMAAGLAEMWADLITDRASAIDKERALLFDSLRS